jgi:carboxypeptidase C (cathepsin A)
MTGETDMMNGGQPAHKAGPLRGLFLAGGVAIAALAWVGPLGAQAAMGAEVKADTAKAKDEKPAPPKSFRSARTGSFNTIRLNYSIIAGETRLRNDKDEEIASIFSTAYLKTGEKPEDRPVVFMFNGGPGSASVWLHIGVFGPRRVDVPSDGSGVGAPPYKIIDNPQTILDAADLVFVDPVGTGYSRAVGKADDKDFFGVEEDAASMATFIRQWISDNKRWNSPKYLAGESYGAFRVGAVAKSLANASNWVSLNGLMLVSGAVDFDALSFDQGSDGAYWSYLPTYAATAWRHDRVADKSMGFEKFLDEARVFALEEYAPALLAGNRLAEAKRQQIIAKLARFTGLSPAYIERANLRISGPRYQKELLRDQGVSLGRFDGRYKGDDYDDAGETPDADPSLYGIVGAYTSGINDYFADLGIDMGREYRILGSLGGKWNWKTKAEGRQTTLNAAPWIGKAMRENPGLRVFAAMGYYDMATPFFAVENALNGPGIPSQRVTWSYYEGGHMMYVHQSSLDRLMKDMRAFIQAGAHKQP